MGVDAVFVEDDGIGGAAMKEEEGGCSSQKRRAEWASLHPELVQLIADCLLSTSGVDEYMGIRAVCASWRSSVAKPSPHAAVADLRFRPRQWVLLNGADDDQGRPLFLNVTTGRFRRLRHPVLHDYIDGLLVLGDREPPHAACLLNPLTGDMLPFAAPIPREPCLGTAVTGPEPTIIFSFEPRHGEYEDLPSYYSLQRGGIVVYSADPTGQLRAVKFHDAAYNEEELFFLLSMVTYAGNVYMLSAVGILYKIVRTGGHWYAERITEVYVRDKGALVESAGKLLLVTEQLDTFKVFTVDAKRKVLEPIKSIGSSALFLCYGKCLLVDSDKLPSIECNCIYITIHPGYRIDSIDVTYDLNNGKRKYITSVPGDGLGAQSRHEGPLSLAQVLLGHCSEIDAQQDRIRCQI